MLKLLPRVTPVVAVLLACAIGRVGGYAAPTSGPVRVLLVAPDAATARELAPLQAALAKVPGIQPTLAGTASASGTAPRLASLRDADAAIFLRGPGASLADESAVLREFLASGKGIVVLAGSAEAWPAEADFTRGVIGAMPGRPFAGGAPMTIINLFPHPIFTGIERFDTNEPIPLFEKLADDAQMIMEGTVGEATAPLAWVRRRPGGRACHIVPAATNLLRDAAYHTIVANAVLWTLGRPIPGAQAAVQRTFMPDSYPGSFAITLPNGPGVCLDPVRGGINYIWEGDFVDLRPRWITKQGESPRIFGEIFYREKEWQPLRAGTPGSNPDFHFLGYTLQDGYPEFHYKIGGRHVYERLGPGKDGAGLERRFRVGPGASPLWLNLESQPDADVVVRGLERDGNLATFASSAAGEFTIEIRRKTVGVP